MISSHFVQVDRISCDVCEVLELQVKGANLSKHRATSRCPPPVLDSSPEEYRMTPHEKTGRRRFCCFGHVERKSSSVRNTAATIQQTERTHVSTVQLTEADLHCRNVCPFSFLNNTADFTTESARPYNTWKVRIIIHNAVFHLPTSLPVYMYINYLYS